MHRQINCHTNIMAGSKMGSRDLCNNNKARQYSQFIFPTPYSITFKMRCELKLFLLLYFFSYFLVIRQSFFLFQNNPKNLDLSFKADLDVWDYLGRIKLVLWQNFIGLI